MCHSPQTPRHPFNARRPQRRTPGNDGGLGGWHIPPAFLTAAPATRRSSPLLTPSAALCSTFRIAPSSITCASSPQRPAQHRRSDRHRPQPLLPQLFHRVLDGVPGLGQLVGQFRVVGHAISQKRGSSLAMMALVPVGNAFLGIFLAEDIPPACAVPPPSPACRRASHASPRPAPATAYRSRRQKDASAPAIPG